MLDVRLDDDTLDTPCKHEFSKDADDHDSELEPSHDPSDDGFTFTAVLVGGLNMWRDVVKHLCGIKFPVFVAVLGSVLLVAFSALPGDICITQNVGKVISTICLISESNWVMALHLSVLGTVLGSVCSRSIMRGLQHPIALIMTARLLPVRARAYASGSSRSGAIGAAAAAPSPVTIGYVTDVEGDLGFWRRYCAISEVIDDSGGLDELRLHPGCHFVFGGDSVDKSSGDLRFLRSLLALRRRHPDRVHLVLGNRDINKMRLLAELDESRDNWLAASEHPGVYWRAGGGPEGAPVADIDEWLAALNAFARKEVNAWSADVDEVARTGKGAEWAGRHDRTGFGFFDRPGGLKATDGH
ncbi:hypothetical protein Ctob_003976 [Chrysochromulina tobinii]|uniref:Calcineurin-like phosphoesterase domain-containing protein n=1 Tax=Chrysochromulina tobinii TaxID=1460289 RepID=A0A0M0JHE4_9EUKA|nr:hypothetical protein Ctob_003976 [Chrysochromulina tobinii]|eukprot:KOO25767.1 hypothetical protein Ctob_003976 [Chrysochromulina sp. CCMP291]